MKKYITVSVLCICMAMQYIAFANAPCTIGFALGYAIAQRDLAAGEARCKEFATSGPCREEINRAFNSTAHNLEQAFNGCCCANGYVECCN